MSDVVQPRSTEDVMGRYGRPVWRQGTVETARAERTNDAGQVQVSKEWVDPAEVSFLPTQGEHVRLKTVEGVVVSVQPRTENLAVVEMFVGDALVEVNVRRDVLDARVSLTGQEVSEGLGETIFLIARRDADLNFVRESNRQYVERNADLKEQLEAARGEVDALRRTVATLTGVAPDPAPVSEPSSGPAAAKEGEQDPAAYTQEDGAPGLRYFEVRLDTSAVFAFPGAGEEEALADITMRDMLNLLLLDAGDVEINEVPGPDVA